MARIGFSQRKTVAYLYAWTVLLAGRGGGVEVRALSDTRRHHYHLGWLVLMIVLGVVAIAASMYLVYVLEILKFKSFRVRELRRSSRGRPSTRSSGRSSARWRPESSRRSVASKPETGRVREGSSGGKQ